MSKKVDVVKVTGSVILIRQNTEYDKKEKDFVSKSGIVIPTDAVKGGSLEQFEGTILAVGELVTKFKKGDYVSFGRNSISLKNFNGIEYIMIYEHSLLSKEFQREEGYTPESDEYVLEGEF